MGEGVWENERSCRKGFIFLLGTSFHFASFFCFFVLFFWGIALFLVQNGLKKAKEMGNKVGIKVLWRVKLKLAVELQEKQASVRQCLDFVVFWSQPVFPCSSYRFFFGSDSYTPMHSAGHFRHFWAKNWFFIHFFVKMKQQQRICHRTKKWKKSK